VPRYRKKPVEVDAVQWWKNGDHPHDRVGEQELDVGALAEQHPEIFDNPDGMVGPVPEDAPTYERLEGAVVRFFRHPDFPGDAVHKRCGRTWDEHGWIDEQLCQHSVCPGDWVLTDALGGHYPCEPHVFAATYEAIT
jgi:hypothetical protein